MSSNAFCSAVTFARLPIAEDTVAVTRTGCAISTIDWIAVIAGDAILAVTAFRQVFARLIAHIGRLFATV